MQKNYEVIPEKKEQKNETFCPCDCTNQLDESTTGKPLVNEKVNKKNSCC